jgi:hypothetical protein
MAETARRSFERRECDECGSRTTPDNKVLKTTTTRYLLLCARCIVKSYGGADAFRDIRELGSNAKVAARYQPCGHKGRIMYVCELDETTYKCQWCWGAEEDEKNPWPQDAIDYLRWEISKP